MAKLVNLYLDGKFPVSTNRLNHFDRLFGQALFGGVEKSVDYAPIISISDALAKPVIDLQCKITAVQEGTGNPSPINIRNFVGFSGLTLHVNTSEISVSWLSEAGIIYGGILNLITGLLTVTHQILVFDGTEEGWNTALSGALISKQMVFSKNLIPDVKCNMYLKGTNRATTSQINSFNPDFSFCTRTTEGYQTNLYIKDSRYVNDLDGFKAWIAEHNLVFVEELATPLTYQLSPSEVVLLAGNNTLWNTAGDTALTYMAKR